MKCDAHFHKHQIKFINSEYCLMFLKLIYFKMRALAEAPLMLMHCHNIEHEYLMSWEHFEDV